MAYGLWSTVGLITGTALVMVTLFSGFASGEAVITQQVGFGPALEGLLHASLVRPLILPASMVVLGKANWYLYPFYSWLLDLRVRSTKWGIALCERWGTSRTRPVGRRTEKALNKANSQSTRTWACCTSVILHGRALAG